MTKLKQLRQQAGLSITEAAQLAQVSRNTLIAAEREQDIQLPALRRIAAVYEAKVQVEITKQQ